MSLSLVLFQPQLREANTAKTEAANRVHELETEVGATGYGVE